METVDKIYGTGLNVSDGIPQTSLDEVFGTGASYSSEWSRPSDWLTLPYVPASEDKMVGLYAVFDTQSEFVAFTATGDFSVDWGDGSAVDNVASGVQAQHQYDYSTISASTLSTRGYKQVIITITPQSGKQLLSVLLDRRHTSASAQVQTSNWLDITCSCNAASTLGFVSTATNQRAAMLENINILNGQNRTSFSAMFTDCYSLITTNLFDTSKGDTFASMFNGCRTITTVKLFDLSRATTVTSMFSGCTAISVLPFFNTILCQNFSSMLLNCFSLRVFPTLNTVAGTNFASMLSGCRALPYIPALNLSSATSLTNMFADSLDISRSLVTGAPVDHSYLNCNLSATALNEIYTNLPVVVGKTITVTGNYGVAGDNPAIATGKGWTVVG